MWAPDQTQQPDPGLSRLLDWGSATDPIFGDAGMSGLMGLAQQVAGSSPAGGSVAPVGGSSNWEQVARQMAMKRGWSPGDFNKLDSIITQESGWNPNAVNPNGGAYGIPQILPSAHPGVDLQGDPMGQIRWLFQYINGRYGGIDQAYAHKQSTGWY